MLRLRTLGGLSLSNGDGPDKTIQLSRHRLALLARVAAAGERGVSRAGLLFQFWPDSDEERGRRALNQIAYSVRRELGEEQLLLGTTELRLNSAVVSSDVSDFTTAAARGDHECAVAAYGGAFLEDFFLSDAPEFERWVEEERARLATAYVKSLDALATAALALGDRAAESEWLLRLAREDRLNSRVARRLIESLAAAGDRAAALRFAQTHEAIVRSELESAPDPAIVALAAQLRCADGAPATSEEAAPVRRTDPATATGAPAFAVSGIPPASRAKPRWRLALGGIAAVFGIAIIALALRPPHALHLGEGGHRDWVVVSDVVNATGDAGFDRAVSLALTAGLERSTRVTVMPMTRIRDALRRMRRGPADTMLDESSAREVASREGARIVVIPAIARAESSYVLTARIVDAGTGSAYATELARARDKGRVLDAIDDIAGALRRDFGESGEAVTRGAVPLPSATTSSLDALQKFADGRAAFREGHYREAEELFKSAIALDSDFALAHVALGQVYYWYDNRRPDGEVHFTRALALLDRLPSSEQMLVRAEIAGWRGDRATAIEILRAYLREHPNDPSAMFSLAYHYMRSHRYPEARDEFVRLTAIDSLNYAVWINLAVVDRAQNDFRGALAASTHAFALDSSALTRGNLNNEYGGTFVSLGLPDSAEWVFRRMLSGSPAQRTSGYQSLAFLDVWSGHYARALSHIDSAMVIDRAENDSAGEARRLLFKVELETNVGAAVPARKDMTRFMSLLHGTYLEPTLLMWAGRISARRGEGRELAEILDTLTHRARRESTPDQAALADVQGEQQLLSGHRGAARASFALAMTLEGELHEREGAARAAFIDHDWPVAERVYRTMRDLRECCYEGDELHLEAPYWLGRAAEARGDRVAARAEYDTLLAQWSGGDSTIIVLRDARARRAAIAAR